MKQSILILLFAGIWITGCSTVRFYEEGTVTDKAEMVQRSWQDMLEITLKDGSWYYGGEFEIKTDTLQWREKNTGELYTTAISDIERVQRISRKRGAFYGGLTGAALGCGIGVYSSIDEFGSVLGSILATIYLCPALATVLSLPGAGIGAIIGYRTNYYWEPAKNED